MQVDCAIVGGGLVGASLALALSKTDLRVVLLDANPLTENQIPSFDERYIALAASSITYLKTLDIDTELVEKSAPIKHIHVSDQGHFGKVRLHAEAFDLTQFGAVAAARDIGSALYQALREATNLAQMHSARVVAYQDASQHALLDIETEQGSASIEAKLVVAADGAYGLMKKLLGNSSSTYDYCQSAIIANLQMTLPHQGWAYERFTPQGPLALLPISEDTMSLVYSVPQEEGDAIMALDDTAFCARLLDNFGMRLGKVRKLGKRSCFPLKRVKSRREFIDRVVFIGNSSHSLHPIAGQGFNLGLRDVAALAELLDSGIEKQCFDNLTAVLNRYAEARRNDHWLTLHATEQLARLFSNQHLALVVGRNVGLSLMALFPSLQKPVIKKGMGLA